MCILCITFPIDLRHNPKSQNWPMHEWTIVTKILNSIIPDIKNSHFSQVGPVKPSVHWHCCHDHMSRHVPPCLQGSATHAPSNLGHLWTKDAQKPSAGNTSATQESMTPTLAYMQKSTSQAFCTQSIHFKASVTWNKINTIQPAPENSQK